MTSSVKLELIFLVSPIILRELEDEEGQTICVRSAMLDLHGRNLADDISLSFTSDILFFGKELLGSGHLIPSNLLRFSKSLEEEFKDGRPACGSFTKTTFVLLTARSRIGLDISSGDSVKVPGHYESQCFTSILPVLGLGCSSFGLRFHEE